MSNVILSDIRKVTKVSLPSFPESEVELYEGLLFGQMKELERAKSDMDKGILALQLMIKDWNFVDEKKEKMAVNRESLNKLPMQDLTFLMDKVKVFFSQTEKETRKYLKK